MFKNKKILFIFFTTIISLEIAFASSLKEDLKNWSAEKEYAVKENIKNQISAKITEKIESKEIVGVLLATIDQYGSKLGLPESSLSKLNSFANGYKMYINGNLSKFFGEESVKQMMPESIRKYFNFCYEPVNYKSSSVISNPCDLLVSKIKDICEPLPDLKRFGINGWKKKTFDADESNEYLFNTSNMEFNLNNVNSLTTWCEKKLDDSKVFPFINKVKKLSDKIMNNDPLDNAKAAIYANFNTNVKKIIKNSDVISDIKLIKKVIIKNIDGKKVKIAPLAAIAKDTIENNLAKKYIERQAIEIALEGGTVDDVNDLINQTLLYGDKINTTIENELMLDVAINKKVNDWKMPLIGIYNQDQYLDTLTQRVKNMSVNIDNKLDTIRTLEEDLMTQYKTVLDSWIKEELAYLELMSTDVAITKDYIDSKVKGSKNEVIERMALVEKANRQIYKKAREKIKLQKKYMELLNSFKKKAKMVIIANMPFDINSARKAAGLEQIPIPSNKEEIIQKGVEAIANIAAGEAKDIAQRLIERRMP